MEQKQKQELSLKEVFEYTERLSTEMKDLQLQAEDICSILRLGNVLVSEAVSDKTPISETLPELFLGRLKDVNIHRMRTSMLLQDIKNLIQG